MPTAVMMNSLCKSRHLLWQRSWLYCCPLSTNARKPLIHFPLRRQPDGKPVVSLTLENLRQGSSHNQVQQKQHSKSGPGVHQHSMELPANYGRIPISDEEIDIINLGGAR